MTGSTAVILKGYPRLSETFIAQELLELERAGLRLRIYSMRAPRDKALHAVHEEISAPVVYLPEYLRDAPLRVLKGWLKARRMPGYKSARNAWLRDLKRDFSPNRFRRFGQALVMAGELPRDVTRLYVHFLHTPASVGLYTSLITTLPWSCSAHAKDIWTTPQWELRAKLAAAEWVVTCTRFGRDHLAGLSPDKDKVHLAYHGLDLERFGPAPLKPPSGKEKPDRITMLTVARAVEKKGLDCLIAALGALPADLDWHWHHCGAGELVEPLKASAARHGLDGRITWHGALPQERVLALYRQSDVFVLPCRIADDGDRDGLPNVLMEAQSQQLACISTPVSGVPELIEDGVTGLLVAPDDAPALATAITRLARDDALRQRLARAGEARVRDVFSHKRNIAAILALFGVAKQPATPHPQRQRQLENGATVA